MHAKLEDASHFIAYCPRNFLERYVIIAVWMNASYWLTLVRYYVLLQQGGLGAGLGDMFGQLDLGSEEGEDQLMKMMQGMMSTLLSKDVLYPSLKELCKQVSQPNFSGFQPVFCLFSQ